jgi:hypothetical protein
MMITKVKKQILKNSRDIFMELNEVIFAVIITKRNNTGFLSVT